MRRSITFLASALLIAGCGGGAPDFQTPAASESAATTLAAKEAAAPTNPLRDAYFGNLHVHTAWSFDANINGAVAGPDDAYRWAKGEAIPGGKGTPDLKILRPLDWYSVGDHAEYLGALPLMADPDSPVSEHPLAAAISGDDPEASFAAYTEILDGISKRRNDDILGDPELARSVWGQIVDIADQHYEPGKFTTFAGFEWTSNPGWQNLHRVVIFRDTENVPERPFSAIESDREEDLWAWMNAQRGNGAELLAVAHNGNASDGLMFPIGTTYGGSEVDGAYAETRMRNEPLYELTQIKGTSETLPVLSPNDEFANFEIWDYTLASTATPPERKVGGYAREALIRGLALQAEGKGNPFKFGFIGDSDTHNAAAAVEEDNYSGKFGFENDPKHRLEGPPGVSEAAARQVREFSSGGLAAVWAESNTREAIFDAMVRKETFATSGPRLKVRVFAGWDYPEDIMSRADWLQAAYDGGVPMGGDLSPSSEDGAPTLLVAAMKEPDGANLDRIQIVKGWIENGEQMERIYDVALSGDRIDGSEPVGTTVDVATASYTNDIGAASLTAAWTDPDFDPAVPALYYARVLQIPTPRWSTYDAKELGVDVPEGLPTSIQERAWSSPIWYSPE